MKKKIKTTGNNNGEAHLFRGDDNEASHTVRIEITADTMLDEDGRPIYEDANDWAETMLEDTGHGDFAGLLAEEYDVILYGYVGE